MTTIRRISVFTLGLLLTAGPALGQVRTGGPGDVVGDVISQVSDTAIASTVRHLESFGTRYAQFSHRFAVAGWIMQKFLDAGISDVDTVGFIEGVYYTRQVNVVATIPGTAPGGEELIIGAHYDSQSSNISFAPGADDNASGVAGILEMARVLMLVNYQPKATIRFVAFAAEELGLHGGYDFVDKALAAGSNIVLMQNYDMIAYRDTSEGDRNVSINHYQAALSEANMLFSLMETYTTLTPHTTTENITRSDSWPFALRGYKAVFVIEDEHDFNPNYHSVRDSSTYLDFTYAAEIVQAGLAMTLSMDALVTGIHEESAVPPAWTLGQNFPNPFNPTTQIHYTIPVAGRVRLWVHSLLGEPIAELDAGWKEGGTHTVRWNPTVASGVYYYTLLAVPGDVTRSPFRQTRKMIFLR